MQLVNQIFSSLVTAPGGSTPVATSLQVGSVLLNEIDCTNLTLTIATSPATGAAVTLAFPSAPSFSLKGFISYPTLENILNTINVYTTGTLPAANTVPAGFIALNSTTGKVLVSNGTIWTGGLNIAQNENAAQIGPGVSESFDSPNITPTGSGVISVNGSITGTINAQQVTTVNLFRDGISGVLLVSNTQGYPPGAGGSWDLFSTLTWFDTLPDMNAHYYTIQAVVAGGATLTIPIGGADFQLQEL